MARKHDDLGPRRAIQDSFKGFQAIRVRHPHVEQHDMGFHFMACSIA
jgi:hypothetical protein